VIDPVGGGSATGFAALRSVPGTAVGTSAGPIGRRPSAWPFAGRLGDVQERLTELTVYDQVGGWSFFEGLVDRFYEVVARDPVLLPLYPEAPDLTGARHRLTLFLVQYSGGPTTYTTERGHPRLRMRHAPFAIGGVERDRWLAAMRTALDGAGTQLEGGLRARLWAYFTMAAEAMRNQPG
jgi:hemoglobin